MFAQPAKKQMKCLKSAAYKYIYKAMLFVAIAGCSVTSIESARAIADELDKTDCSGVVLDDSEFTEVIVRDHRDESYGSLTNSAVRPLGGGEGYDNIILRPLKVLDPGFKFAVPMEVVVRTADELRAVLPKAAQSPRTIYVDDNAEIDLSYCAKKPTPRRLPTIRDRVRREIATISHSSSPRTRRSQVAAGAPGHAGRACSRARLPLARC